MGLPSGAQLLLIDEDGRLVAKIKAHLEDSGFTVWHAASGREGLQYLQGQRFDLVVLDLQLRTPSGLEIITQIYGWQPQLPIVMLTRIDDVQEVIEGLRLGAWDFVTKPLKDVAVLEHVICRALERSRLLEENRSYRLALEEANLQLKTHLDILQRDQEAGRSVQNRLLPEPNRELGGIRWDYRVIPSLYLSGDCIDYFAIDDRHVGFYIADVSGHGASSAFVTILLKSIMNQVLTQYQNHSDPQILDPSKVLARIANELYTAKLGKYSTLIYGVVQPRKRLLQYAIGGHYPPPILLTGGQARFLPGRGFPVGIAADAHYEVQRLVLPEDARLLLFSDGVMETLGERDLHGKEKRLLELVQTKQGDMQGIMQALQLSEQRALPDDVTIFSLALI